MTVDFAFIEFFLKVCINEIFFLCGKDFPTILKCITPKVLKF